MDIRGMNFNWLYKEEFREEFIKAEYDDRNFKSIDIPHSNLMLPFNNFDEKSYQFDSCYRKHFKLDKLKEEECVFIKFHGMMACGRVYLNGVYLGEHKSGYTPFRIDVSKYIKEENCLVVHLDSRERGDMPPFGFVIDYLTYGGIYREVEIEQGHRIHIENTFVKTSNVMKNAFLDMKIKFSEQRKKVDIVISVDDMLEKNFEIETSDDCKISFQVGKVDLWQIDNPRLYSIKIQVFYEGKLVDSREERIGFREAIFKENGFYLNGNKVKLLGLNRHQSYPYVGYAMPKSAQVKDADILKFDLGLNVVRTSHYPQSRHFLDRCDEIGLLVFEEIPGWQHIGDEEWQLESLKDVKRMILRDMNHPSIIMWGTRINESRDDNEFYERTYKLAKELDDSRQVGGVRCIKKSNLIEDVYTYNDFVFTGENNPLEKKRRVTGTSKPYLITEFNGHMFPTKKYDSELKRTEHAIRHTKVINHMMGDDKITGAVGWCMFDYNTHKDFGSGDGICYHGVLDMFRIPKIAAYSYSSQRDNKAVMHITSSLNIGDYPSSLLKEVYIYTNCDYVELYKGNELIKKFLPDKKRFPNLKHAPIIVDDFVGEEIEKNEEFSSFDARIVKNILREVSKNGDKIKLIDKMKMGYIFAKYKMNQLDAEDLYTKYFGGWGSEGVNYTFKGIRDGEVQVIQKKGKYYKPEIVMEVDNDTLIVEDTYDVTRVVVKMVDENGNEVVYANDTFKVSTEGAIELIGPSVLALIGGSIGFWVRSKKSAGEGRILVKSERFGEIEKKIFVKNISVENY